MNTREEQRAIDAEVARTAEALREESERGRALAEAGRDESEDIRLWAEEGRRAAELVREDERRRIADLRARVDALERLVADLREKRGER